jgi:flavin-binding protein dodecin
VRAGLGLPATSIRPALSFRQVQAFRGARTGATRYVDAMRSNGEALDRNARTLLRVFVQPPHSWHHLLRRIARGKLHRESSMAEKTYTIIEVVGVSHESIHQAIRNALTKARQTVRNLDWFEVGQIRGAIRNGEPEFQVQVRIGFRLE